MNHHSSSQKSHKQIIAYNLIFKCKYNDYIYNMIHDIKLDGTPNKLAIKVKLADIFSNLSDNPSEYAKQKYAKALLILL